MGKVKEMAIREQQHQEFVAAVKSLAHATTVLVGHVGRLPTTGISAQEANDLSNAVDYAKGEVLNVQAKLRG